MEKVPIGVQGGYTTAVPWVMERQRRLIDEIINQTICRLDEICLIRHIDPRSDVEAGMLLRVTLDQIEAEWRRKYDI